MNTISKGSNVNGTEAIQHILTTEVCFRSNGLKIAGILRVPESVKTPSAALVIGHPGSGVKEQTAGLYAQLLAEKGFITLTFDAAHQGESEGMPRGLEDPAQRTEDFKCAVSFLHTVDLVDTAKIGVFGMCAGGGYSIAATAADHRIKALATIITADIGRQFRKGGDGKQDPSVFQHLLDLAAADRTAEAKGKEPGTFPLFPATAEQAKGLNEHDYEGWEYYCTERGQHPRSMKLITWNSVDRIAGFDAFAFIDQISPRPLLMISGSKAVTLWMTQEAFAAAKAPKELLVIEGANHMALYDNPEYTKQAVAKADSFFRSVL
ncbi:MAG: alpha/beta hydrolase [Chitinophagaceae bacterium]